MTEMFAILNNHTYSTHYVKDQFITHIEDKKHASYTRFINTIDLGVNHRERVIENQPILIINNIALIFDGILFNTREINKYLKAHNTDNISDHPHAVVIFLYEQYGIDGVLQLLDGDFTFVLIDYRLTTPHTKMYVVRDPVGLRPLYFIHYIKNVYNKYIPFYGISSKIKMLTGFIEDHNGSKIVELTPGHYTKFELSNLVNASWTMMEHNKCYYKTPYSYSAPFANIMILQTVQTYLIKSMIKRIENISLPKAAFILNATVENSIIASILTDYCLKHNLPPINTYSVGVEGSDELKYNRLISEHIGTTHTEIVVRPGDIIDAIPFVINATGVCEPAMIKASISTWIIAEYISKNRRKIKYVFTGDGADALMVALPASTDALDYDLQIRRQLENIHKREVLMAERCLSAHKLTCIMPYLDRSFIQAVMSMPCEIRFSAMGKKPLIAAFMFDEFMFQGDYTDITEIIKTFYSDVNSTHYIENFDEQEYYFTFFNTFYPIL